MTTPGHERLFERVVACAVANERCPTNDHMRPGMLQNLARDGRIRIEVFALNWRVVTILEGPHAGKQTQRGPHMTSQSIPYVVIDGRSGPARKDIPAQVRQEPWRPGDPKPVR